MGSLTDYMENSLLNHIFENSEYFPVSNLYVALFTADPTDVGLLTNEVSGNGYARTEIFFSAAGSRAILQNGDVTFPQCSGGDWSTITHWGIADSSIGGAGNLLAYGSFTSPIVTYEGNVINIPTANIQVSITSGGASNYLANLALDFIFRDQIFNIPNIHIGLCSATPLDSDTGSTITEISGNNYSRVDFNDWITSTAGSVSNNNNIVFPSPTGGDWDTVTYSVVLDAASAGNLLCYAPALPNQAPLENDTVVFPTGSYTINLS